METIYARNTTVRKISVEEATVFLNENHRQMSTSSTKVSVSLGLYSKNDELLAVIQFCAPRTADKRRNYSSELLRLAFKRNIRVVGGASKLISHYVKTYKPADFFTYQDTTGENSLVYQSAGMTLVETNKTKKYLVAPGATVESGSRKEVLGIPYATRFGPDRILGTSLGEIIDENGKRKTNYKLFVEELGWHVEETSGDSVWEWVDTQRTYYTYKITAADSAKYYYGVSHVKKADASVEDCLNDGYWGSGGVKFSNWKMRHKNQLNKEILSIHNRAAGAFAEEERLIGDLWINDEKCLNSSAGGFPRTNNSPQKTVIQECVTHGKTKHQGNSCLRCVQEGLVTTELCEKKHGLTTFRGGQCASCLVEKSISIKKCPTHGEVKFIGNSCYFCQNNRTIVTKKCEKHGETSFKKNNCMKCSAEKSQNMKECNKHGYTKFRGDACGKCKNEAQISMKECDKHGLTKHNGAKCYRCGAESRKKPVRVA